MSNANTMRFFHVTQKYTNALGRFIVSFGELEAHLHRALWQIMDLSPEEGPALTAPIMSFKTRALMLLTIGRMRVTDTDLLSDLEDINQALEKINATRNNLVHGQWAYSIPDDDLIAVSRVSAGGQINWREPVPYTAKSLHQWTQYTADAAACLAFFTVNFRKGNRVVTPERLDKPPQ